MSDEYVYFNVSVGWYDPNEDKRPAHPLSGLLVKVYYHRKGDKYAHIIDEGHLDENGKFSCKQKVKYNRIFDKDTSFVTYIFSETEDSYTFWRKTKNGVNNRSERYFSTKYQGRTTNSNFELNCFGDGVDRRLFLASMIHIAGRFLKEAYKVKPKTIKCLYPDTFTTKGVSFADISKNTIHVIEKDFNYRPLQTIFHEYGHTYQHMFIAKKYFDGASHGLNMDLSVNRTKEKGIRQAFIEGHATYFASRVADKYKSLLSSNLRSGLVYENMDTTTEFEGEGNESNIYYFLYDLTDGGNLDERSLYRVDGFVTLQKLIDSVDWICYDDSEIHALFKGLKDPTLYNFVQAFMVRHPDDKDKLNILFTLNGISPGNITSKRLDLKKDIFEIEWEPGGAKSSCSTPECNSPKGVCKTNQDECVIDLYAPGKLDTVIASSGKVKNKESYEFKWSDLEYLQKNGYNHVVAKVKGVSTEEPKTEYESTYCSVGFISSYDDKKDAFTLLPNLFLISCHKDEPKELNFNGLKIKATWYGIDYGKSFLFSVEKTAYIKFEFVDKTFNNLEIDCVGNLGNDDPTYLVTIVDKEGNRTEVRYPQKTQPIMRRRYANLPIDGCFFMIQVLNDPPQSQIIKRIVFSNKPRMKVTDLGTKVPEGRPSSVFGNGRKIEVGTPIISEGKKPKAPKK